MSTVTANCFVEELDDYADVEVEVDDVLDDVLEEASDQDIIDEYEARNLHKVSQAELEKDQIVKKLQDNSDFDNHNLICDVLGISYYESNKKEIVQEWIDKILKAR